MKQIILMFFLFLISFNNFSQDKEKNHEISEFEKTIDKNQLENLIKYFNFDKTKLLISLNEKKYVLFSVDSLTLFKVRGNKIIKMNSKNSKIISEVNFNNLFKINPLNLNETNLNESIIKVSDGHEYKMVIYKSDKNLTLESYVPEIYIKNEYPYYQERKVFLENYNILNNLFEDENYLKIKEAKKVFIKFDSNTGQSKRIIKDKNILVGNEIFNINGVEFFSVAKAKNIVLRDYDDAIIIDSEFLKHYFTDELYFLLKENKNEIFIIESCRTSKNKFKATQVR
jgi:hypothetical protein